MPQTPKSTETLVHDRVLQNTSGATAKIRSGLKRISIDMGLGDPEETVQNILRGTNYRAAGHNIPRNQDHFGYIFFTRPCLNLSYSNVLADPRLTTLLSESKSSINRYVRATLDSKANRGLKPREEILSDLVDPLNPFIPLLGNNTISAVGFPDLLADTWTSEEGLYGEVTSQYDGSPFQFKPWDININFRNIAGDPVTILLDTWVKYGLNVTNGIMAPYPEYEAQNRYDYNTGIWRIVTNSSKTIVTKISRTIGFPVASPIGAAFNFNEELKPMGEENTQISTQFRCIGFEALDRRLIEEFNMLHALWNPMMRTDPTTGKLVGATKGYIKMKDDLYNLGNCKSYPYINPVTAELEWWADSQVINAMY